ncbi:Transposase IS200 like protein [Marinomonas aquimarina]|uniref:Transposase IS200 like protein n=1 Tax=Marinomonas aquimarina TaxID=295068 RepID=A0A1A8T3A5_9GAMM|nr:transposase [Marinomonas aquimarina]SBS25854.1 Transposase IS200 like protein [Marinomonas aquimarina]
MLTKGKGYSALRRGRSSSPESVYHVVFNTLNRAQMLQDFQTARAVIKAMQFCQQQQYCHTVAFCIMPDHVHWLIQPLNKQLSQVVHSVKRYTSSEQLKWSDGFYDSAVRSETELIDVARYIIANPKRAGLVSSVKDYPHWDTEYL